MKLSDPRMIPRQMNAADYRLLLATARTLRALLTYPNEAGGFIVIPRNDAAELLAGMDEALQLAQPTGPAEPAGATSSK